MADITELTEEEFYSMSEEEQEAAFEAAMALPADDVEYEDVGEEPEVEDEISEEITDVSDEEEIADELEQPDDQDSDDDASSDEDGEVETEEESETTEDEPTGESEEEEEPTAEVDTETKPEEQPVQKRTFKANGKEYEFTDAEIMEKFPMMFGQAMDYTRKMQAIKPWRKTIDAIESAKLNHDDVNLMIDVLKGDKGAIAEVIKRTGVDTLELDTEENKYTPQDYGRDDTTLAINDVISDISSDPEYTTTQKILGKEWDDASWGEMSKQPEMIKLLHNDVKSGMYNKVQPIAEKLKVYDKGMKSDLDYYKQAVGVYFSQLEQEQMSSAKSAQLAAEQEAKQAEQARIAEVKQKQTKVNKVKTESAKRRAAAPTKKSVAANKSVDFLNGYPSEEEFEKFYKELEDRM